MSDKHWPECWCYASHHACAVAEIGALRAAPGEERKADQEMADYGDGNWHASTLGQFIGQLVDEGDSGVIFRQVSVTPHEGNQQSTRWEVILVADGHITNYLGRCKSVHKTLIALLNAGLAS